MAKKVAPGVLCRIISGHKGPKSPNVGRTCKVIRQQELLHVVWGPLWLCQSTDGQPFVLGSQLSQGASAMSATFAEDWLEPLEDEPPKQETRTKEKELEH